MLLSEVWLSDESDGIGFRYRHLAASVVRQAFQDLLNTDKKHGRAIRQDAYDFLVSRLWQGDCLWRELLEGVLDREQVVKTARRMVMKSRRR